MSSEEAEKVQRELEVVERARLGEEQGHRTAEWETGGGTCGRAVMGSLRGLVASGWS